MLQGVGSRYDFHMNKTLCDLRLVKPQSWGFCHLIVNHMFQDEGNI